MPKNIQIYNARRFCILGLDHEGTQKLSLIIEIGAGMSIIKLKKLITEIDDLLIEFKKQNYNMVPLLSQKVVPYYHFNPHA